MSGKTVVDAIRLFAGTILGYLSLYLFLILTLEIILEGNITYHTSSVPVLIQAGIYAFISSLLAGAIGCLITGRWWYITPFLMTALSLTETTYLISVGTLTGPLWFDLLASSNLGVGFFAGTLCYHFLFRRLASRPKVANDAA